MKKSKLKKRLKEEKRITAFYYENIAMLSNEVRALKRENRRLKLELGYDPGETDPFFTGEEPMP